MFRTAVRRATTAAASNAAAEGEIKAGQSALKKGAKRDPELYVWSDAYVPGGLLTSACRSYSVSCLEHLGWPDSTLV